MRRKTRDFGRLKLIAFFVLVAVLLPKFINARSTDELGAFSAGETGIKLCARINNGYEDALRFSVTSDQGFSSDVIVAKDTCKTIETAAANYTIREYLPQEYELISVSGGTVSADATAFVATAEGQYTVIYENTYSSKPYLHNFGYTGSNTTATAVGVKFDANGGTGSMDMQLFGLNAQQNLASNAFTRDGYIFTGWNTKADGTGESYTDDQPMAFATGGELTLYAQWEYASREAADIVKRLANDLGDYKIDFTRKAIVSDNIATANGNGVNKYTENGQDIYYFRGQVANNNVIWAGKCWKIVRTTATGGTKMIYNGEVDTVENSDGDLVPTNTCTATGTDAQISYNNQNTFAFNTNYTSPADVGYMYGERLDRKYLPAGSTSFVFANDVYYNNGIYYLSDEANSGTLSGTGIAVDSIEGTWADQRTNAAVKYHYFCTSGSAKCGGDEIGYITYFGDSIDNGISVIKYLNIAGYDNIEAAKTAMFVNSTDSNAKATIEAWFESENLDGHIAGTRNFEDDLEDTVFCNDRSYYSGSLKGKDSDATPSGNTAYSYHSAYGRNAVIVDGNYHPSLDCTNKDDAFTKSDTVSGNGKLAHKVGLITADELTMAGTGKNINGNSAYLYTGQNAWAASPHLFYSDSSAREFSWLSEIPSAYYVYYPFGLRPLVSLKSGIEFADNGADGTSTNPYIVE